MRFLPLSLVLLSPLAMPVQAGSVIFTEVMYHPQGDRPEFIEISNLTSNRMDMARWQLSGEVSYRFPEFTAAAPAAHLLNEYERVILSSATPAETRAAWPAIPAGVRIFGPWQGSLSNASGSIVLADAAAARQCALSYRDGGDWPVAADGAGHSLQIIRQNGNVDDWRNWRASQQPGGTPGWGEMTGPEELVPDPITREVVAVNFSTPWLYWRNPEDPDGTEAEGTWMAPAFPATGWSGPSTGLFGRDLTNPILAGQIATSFADNYLPATATYYFRTTFEWSGALTGQTFSIDHYLDDGVIYWLNGQEIRGTGLGRVRMPAGVATHTTTASGQPAGNDALLELNGLTGALGTGLVAGTNVLCAEVHQSSAGNDDIIFGARMRIQSPAVASGLLISEVKPGTLPGAGFVEIWNTTTGNLDLNGYYLSDNPAQPKKHRIEGLPPVAGRGYAVIDFAAAGLAVSTPLVIVLTQPDGLTRQHMFSADLPADGRSMGQRVAGNGTSWAYFATPTPGAANIPADRVVPSAALNEVHFSTSGRVDWVELVNNSAVPLSGLSVSDNPDFLASVAVPGSIAPGQRVVVPADFSVAADGSFRLFLHDAGRRVHSAAELTRGAGFPALQAMPEGSGEWFTAAVPTPGLANSPSRHVEIVITEIMAAPPSGHEDGEFVELMNYSRTTVDLSGWQFSDGISFQFPPGTTLVPGARLVVAKSPAYMNANYTGLTAVFGPFSGTLRNSGEKVRLEDASGNLADEVDYASGGQWPAGAGGEGSSLELIHPAMDNSQPSAWRASDESTKAEFQTFTHTGTYKELRGTPGGTTGSRELLLNLVSDGHIVMKSISLTRAAAPTVNQIKGGDATSHVGNGVNGFLCTGTHCDSDTLADGFHLISAGGGDTKANKAEVDVIGILPNDTLTFSFQGRWVSGLPLLVVQTWDRSFGKVFRLPIPGNLGTPGAVNSMELPAPAPVVDQLKHFPVVPISTQPVVVSARVASVAGLTSVNAVHRLDSVAGNGAWASVAMNDSGTAGDAVAGDGIWSATIPAKSDSSITQFYVEATAADGKKNTCPRDPLTVARVNGTTLGRQGRPAMWIVDNSPPASAPGLLVERSIISQRDRNALNSSTGYSSAFDFDHPRMSNFGWNSTIIWNETEVRHNCDLRRGGSPWTRIGTNTLDRSRWKPPGDDLFRERTKSGVDNDSAGASRFHNRMVRYMMYLFDYPVPDAEFIQQIVNADAPRIGDSMEQTDSDFFERAYPEGEGELFEIDDAWFMYDSNNMDDRLDAGSVTGRWALTDWTSTTAGTNPSDESPIFFHGNWPLRFPEKTYDYAALSAFIKVAANNNTSVTAAQETAWREQMERMIDVDRAAIYAAVRGYIGDWDNFTLNRGKNGYFYRRPTDGKFEFHHWDSDLGFQNSGEAFIGSAGGIGWTNFSNRPWFRQRMNFFLSELVTRYTRNSPRMTAWLDGLNYQSTNSNALAPFKTTGFNYPTTWFAAREANATSFVSTANFNRAFTVTTTNNQTVTTPVFSLAGAASSKVARVDVEGHPEATFLPVPTAANNGLWTITGIRLRSGLNVLAVRALGSDGVIQNSVNLNVTLTGDSPPVVAIDTDPQSRNIGAGELLRIDTAGSYDPEATALTWQWSVQPSAGVTITHPTPDTAEVRCLVPGICTVTATATDGAGSQTSRAIELTVFSTSDFVSFGGLENMPGDFTVSNTEKRDNFSPSGWYSVSDLSGQLVIQILEDSAKPLAAPVSTYPLVTRQLPAQSDFVLQTSLTPDTRAFGNWQSGLFLHTTDLTGDSHYAFYLDGGRNLVVKQALLPADYTQLATLAYTGTGASLRVRRSGLSLVFEASVAGAWTTVHTATLAAAANVARGGIFAATSAATTVRTAFDYLLVADPQQADSVMRSLRVTEVNYNPAAGGVEFIELQNTGAQAIDLTGVSFEAGMPFAMDTVPVTAYTFGSVSLAPGEIIVIPENTALFQSLYGNAIRLAPPWTSGNLSNSGERIHLRNAAGDTIQDFTYSDGAPWPAAADGTGASLQIVSSGGAADDPANWRAAPPNPGSDGAGAPSGFTLSVSLAADQSIQLNWNAQAGQTYHVEASPDLLGWTRLGSVVGTGTYRIPPPHLAARQYFRIVTGGG